MVQEGLLKAVAMRGCYFAYVASVAALLVLFTLPQSVFSQVAEPTGDKLSRIQTEYEKWLTRAALADRFLVRRVAFNPSSSKYELYLKFNAKGLDRIWAKRSLERPVSLSEIARAQADEFQQALFSNFVRIARTRPRNAMLQISDPLAFTVIVANKDGRLKRAYAKPAVTTMAPSDIEAMARHLKPHPLTIVPIAAAEAFLKDYYRSKGVSSDYCECDGGSVYYACTVRGIRREVIQNHDYNELLSVEITVDPVKLPEVANLRCRVAGSYNVGTGSPEGPDATNMSPEFESNLAAYEETMARAFKERLVKGGN